MIPDPAVWCQSPHPRGASAWYRRTDARRKDPRYIKTCGHCDNEFLGRRKGRFCSKSCSGLHKVQPPPEIPGWIDTAVWRPGNAGTWYKSGFKTVYVIKACARCGADYLGQRKARFCSVTCISGGDGKSYGYAHQIIGRKKGPARDQACADCGAQAAEWSYDGMDPDELVESESGKRYSFNPDHYQPRCHYCHAGFDEHFGEGNGRAKLTDAQRHEIQVSLSMGTTQKRLAERFGVTQGHISRIKRGVVGIRTPRRPVEEAVPLFATGFAGLPALAGEAEGPL